MYCFAVRLLSKTAQIQDISFCLSPQPPNPFRQMSNPLKRCSSSLSLHQAVSAGYLFIPNDLFLFRSYPCSIFRFLHIIRYKVLAKDFANTNEHICVRY